MKRSYRSLVAVLLLTGLAACGGTGSVVDDKEFNQALTEAKAAHKKAEDVNNAWTTTEKAIEGAEEAKTAGDMEKAMKLAKKAKSLAELSYQQYEKEKNATAVFPD